MFTFVKCSLTTQCYYGTVLCLVPYCSVDNKGQFLWRLVTQNCSCWSCCYNGLFDKLFFQNGGGNWQHYELDQISFFTESAHWADSVIESRCLSVCTSVCVYVCPLWRRPFLSMERSSSHPPQKILNSTIFLIFFTPNEVPENHIKILTLLSRG